MSPRRPAAPPADDDPALWADGPEGEEARRRHRERTAMSRSNLLRREDLDSQDAHDRDFERRIEESWDPLAELDRPVSGEER